MKILREEKTIGFKSIKEYFRHKDDIENKGWFIEGEFYNGNKVNIVITKHYAEAAE